jgi:hypothetical protein
MFIFCTAYGYGLAEGGRQFPVSEADIDSCIYVLEGLTEPEHSVRNWKPLGRPSIAENAA